LKDCTTVQEHRNTVSEINLTIAKMDIFFFVDTETERYDPANWSQLLD